MSVTFNLSLAERSAPADTPKVSSISPRVSNLATVAKAEVSAPVAAVPNESAANTVTQSDTTRSATPDVPDVEPDYLASYLNNAAPSYPVVARRLGWQGKVLVSVEVLADGHAGQVILQRSSGHPVLDEAALSAIKGWHFNPARHAGLAVDKWFLIPVPFVLKESE